MSPFSPLLKLFHTQEGNNNNKILLSSCLGEWMGIRVRCTFSKDDDGDAEQKRYLQYYDGWCGDNEDKDGFGFFGIDAKSLLRLCCNYTDDEDSHWR